MTAGEATFPGAGGLSLFRRWWRPAAPRLALVNVHGLGDHSGLYPMLPERLVPAGISVHMLDLRGHGRSDGPRAYVERWDEFRADLDSFHALVRREEPGVPTVVVGNSLGGLIVLEWVLTARPPVAGVVAVAPAIGDLAVPMPLLLLARALSSVWPRFTLRTGLDLAGISRDPAALQAILADPLFHRVGTARLATEVEGAIARVRRLAPTLASPALLLHGTADRMVPPAGSRAFAAAAPAGLVTHIEYPGAYHALFADLDAPRVLADLLRWADSVTRPG